MVSPSTTGNLKPRFRLPLPAVGLAFLLLYAGCNRQRASTDGKLEVDQQMGSVTASNNLPGIQQPPNDRPATSTAAESPAASANIPGDKSIRTTEQDPNADVFRIQRPPADPIVSNAKTKHRPVPVVQVKAVQAKNCLNFIGWNVESDGNDPQVIAKQLSGFQGYDLFALTEVRGRPSYRTYTAAFNRMWKNAKTVLPETGRDDRLMVAFNADVLELLKAEELNDLNPQMKYRSPFALTLRHKPTGTTFILMNNHLARGNATNRQAQALGLREWARTQTLPVIAMGDYNFDYVFTDKRGNQSFADFMQDGIWKWIQPEEWVDSNWYDGDKDGKDDYPGSMLDFAFVAGPAKDWKCQCRIISWEGDFPDDDSTSDHRPVELSIELPTN